MKQSFKKLLVISMILAAAQQSQALTVMTFLVGDSTGQSLRNELQESKFRFFVIGGASLMGLLAGPVGALGFLLDDSQNQKVISDLSTKIEKYATTEAEKAEATDLAVLLTNSLKKEIGTGNEVTISADELDLTAPQFSRSANFQNLLNDLNTQSIQQK